MSSIPLRVADGNAYVWDVDDIATLRSSHRICGSLVGTLPHLSQQNLFLGVPLLLFPEEVTLLVEKKLAILIDDPSAHSTPPTHLQLSQWSSQQKKDIDHQRTMAESKQSITNPRAMSTEALQKRQAREAKRRELNTISSTSTTTPSLPPPPSSLPPPPPSSLPPPPPSSLPPPPPPSSLPPPTGSSTSFTPTIIIPTSSTTSLSWYTPTSSHHSHTTLSSAQSAGIWPYPGTKHDLARSAVFRNLWEQDFFIGPGIKFGADYLVYPGDPLRYHSHFAATVIDDPKAPLMPMEIVAHGRLGTATKKTHLLCCWEEENEERPVSYISIEWAGFG